MISEGKVMKVQYLNIFLKLAFIIVLIFMASYVFPESVHLGKSEVSKEEVIQLLAPRDEFAAVKTRGIRLHGQEDRSIEMPTERALSMEIYFEFNSANLTQKAKSQLVPVGEALRSNELSGLQFTLEGHTDAVGNSIYNMELSKRRALSVKQFFVTQFQVSDNRIQALGKGETELLNAIDPGNGVNRRVKIIAQ